MNDLRFPIGKFQKNDSLSAAERADCIRHIAEAPDLLRKAVAGLTPSQLDTPYRPEGWTVRQLVHHLPDSHLNAVVRFRLALTEDHPTIKPYQEQRWAELTDARTAPAEMSLDLLDALHARWTFLLRSLSESDFRRTLLHPDNGIMSLDTLVQLYAWHGRHHVAHIINLRDRSGW